MCRLWMKHKPALCQIEKCHEGEIATAGEQDNPFENGNGHVGWPEAKQPSMSPQRVRRLAGPIAGSGPPRWRRRLLFDVIVPGQVLSRVSGVGQRMATEMAGLQTSATWRRRTNKPQWWSRF